MDDTHKSNEDKKRPASDKIRNRDRRPKGIHPMRRRTISLSREIDRLAENERLRRNFPSVSALIEFAVAKEVQHQEPTDEVNAPAVLRELQFAIHRLERDSAERDVIQVELIAGLARAHFATVPTPGREEQQARIEQAKSMFERYLDAVGRKIESGQTTLAQLPDVQAFAQDTELAGDEKKLREDLGCEGMRHADV